jgi:hypothetical protein
MSSIHLIRGDAGPQLGELEAGLVAHSLTLFEQRDGARHTPHHSPPGTAAVQAEALACTASLRAGTSGGCGALRPGFAPRQKLSGSEGLVAAFLGVSFAIISGGLATALLTGWVAWRWATLRRYTHPLSLSSKN